VVVVLFIIKSESKRSSRSEFVVDDMNDERKYFSDINLYSCKF